MRISRAVAGLLLLALVLGTDAGNRCANCGLGEGSDACNCGNTAVRAKKLSKPDIFASPEAIKNALKFKKAYSASTSIYSTSSPVEASISAYNAVPAPSPIKNLLRPGISIAPKFEPIGDLCHSCKGYKNEVIGVIPARPGKLPCKCPKSESEDKSSPTSAPTYSAPNPTYSASATSYAPQVQQYSSTAPLYSPSALSYTAPAALYSAATPSQTVPEASPSAYGASTFSYSTPVSTQSNQAPLYSSPAAPAQYAPAYQTPAPATHLSPLTSITASTLPQYTNAYQQPSPVVYVAAPSSPTKRSYQESETKSGRNYESQQNAIIASTFNPTLNQYAAAYQEPAPVIYVAAPSQSGQTSYKEAKTKSDCKCKNKQKTQQDSAYQQPTSIIYEAEPSAKRSYKKSKPDYDEKQYDAAYQESASAIYEVPLAKRSYLKSNSEPPCNCKNKQNAITIPATSVQYDAAYQELPPVNYMLVSPPTSKAPCDKSNAQSDHDKGEKEVETYVEIVLQEEQAPTADPVSIAMAYKNLAESHGKKYVAEDSLAYGHYKEPADGRICKHVSNFDEEKLHTVDKPVVELKDCKCENGNCQNIRVGYSDIGYGPVAPSKNRFVPKTDDASYSSYAQSIVYVPPPEDKDSLPYGPLGPTIPGYKSGGVLVDNDSNARSTSGKTIQEGKRQGVLVEEDEYDSDSYHGKGGIIERIKSCACKSGY